MICPVIAFRSATLFARAATHTGRRSALAWNQTPTAPDAWRTRSARLRYGLEPRSGPATADTGHEPGDTLAGFRADARVKGGITFGMNAVIVEGIERMLRPGLRGRATWHFE